MIGGNTESHRQIPGIDEFNNGTIIFSAKIDNGKMFEWLLYEDTLENQIELGVIS
jgi:hypothetical protein